MKKKRLLLTITMIYLMFGFLLGRLMQIQLFQTENFSGRHINLMKESVKQRTHELVLDDGRGQFLDRDGNPLSYEEKSVLVIFPFVKTMDLDISPLSRILNVSADGIEHQLDMAKKPFIAGKDEPFLLTESQAEKINNMKIPGIFAVKKRFLPDRIPAGQLIGIYGENEKVFKDRYPTKDWRNVKLGLTGLQKIFDEFLLPESETKLVYHVDGMGNPLFGADVKFTGQLSPFYPLLVKTTIDRSIQEKMEDLVDKHGIQNGGAILLDIKESEIVAIASRPSINPENPYSDKGANNILFEQMIPGSVFKTVVAAASIEEGIVSESDLFRCDLDIRGGKAERDLGQLPFEESFSRSCNRTFAELAQKLVNKNPDSLEVYARKLGLLERVSWEGDLFKIKGFHHFDHDKGRIFLEEDSKKDKNYIAQTGIGQHEVRLAPISAANMMATIARGGKKLPVKAVSEIQYGDGTVMADFKTRRETGDELSPFAAMKLQQLLRKVVTDPEGTGHHLNDLPFEVAGKSGTAETEVVKNGEQLYHKWFAGYFPFEDPRYVLVTVNMDVPGDEGGVLPLFHDLVTMVFEEEPRYPDQAGSS